MSNHDDEDRDRKIIIDSQVVQVANRGIAAMIRGELTPQQIRALIQCDRDYLEEVREIAPDLVPEW